MSKIGSYVIDRLENDETIEEIMERGFRNENN